MNILIKGSFATNYEEVHKEWVNGSKTRAECCDESRSIISKIDDHNYVALLFEVDFQKMLGLMATPERAEIMRENGIKNEMYQFSPLG
ncbi:MAG: hypothetical protein CMC18_06395 [Flavobacteriaceae bacterium]|nr:hypothetical protein [Flavobacteriaceae bacterium]